MYEPADIDALAMLAEFAQLALDRARAASRRAEAVEAENGDPSVHLVAFDRMGRAMRLALSLRRRLAGEIRAEAVQRVQARKDRLRAALEPAIRIHAPLLDRREREWALAHRLETEAEAFAAMSFDAGVARLASLLGLPLDTPQDPPPQGEGDRVAVEGVEAHSDRRGLQPPQSAALGAPPEGEHLKVAHFVRHVVAEATGPP